MAATEREKKPRPLLSVLLCTHNPDPDVLAQTLSSLRSQSLPPEKWELFLLDNASEPPVGPPDILSWHPRGTIERVSPPGKVHAILRGIDLAESELLMTVDDDNLLDVGYLEEAVSTFEADSRLGIAAGRSTGVFSVPPPRGLRAYLGYLAVRDLGSRPIVEHADDISPWIPFGAGMTFVVAVAEYYAELVKNDPIRRDEHPSGITIGRAQDTDMALCAENVGLKVGYFPSLHLRHLIAAERLAPDAMVKLVEASHYGVTLCRLLHGVYRRPSFVKRVFLRVSRLLDCVRGKSSLGYRLSDAARQAEKRAHRDAARVKSCSTPNHGPLKT